MKVLGLNWVGTRTKAFEESVDFFHATLELPIGIRRAHFTRLDLPEGGCLEVFDAASLEYAHFSTGPVPGFLVADFDDARSELEGQGSALIGPMGGERGNYRWQHFRAPDGCVYEISENLNRLEPVPPVGSLRLTKLNWVGISTQAFRTTQNFFTETMKLTPVEETIDLTEWGLMDGSSVELFRRGSRTDHPHFRTGPVPGFGVVDIEQATEVLYARGVPLLESRRRDWGGWTHFRAPDGCVYELRGPRVRQSLEDDPAILRDHHLRPAVDAR